MVGFFVCLFFGRDGDLTVIRGVSYEIKAKTIVASSVGIGFQLENSSIGSVQTQDN